ncbi:hypothetical protein M0Q50_02235 [bacterium]|jgi:hypothetical protein|nr:hypothetical protein [bacterium]
MKIGDTLYCKTSSGIFECGKSYTITDIVFNGYDRLHYLKLDNHNYQYSIERDNIGVSYKIFFYTQEEMRLKKLNSI